MFKYIKRKIKESKMRELERYFWIEDIYKKMLFESESQEEMEIARELLEDNISERKSLYVYSEKHIRKEKKVICKN